MRSARRSLLDVPGHVQRKLERGLASTADALMVDLEDSVPARDDAKVGARATIAAHLRGTDRDVLVRVNEVGSPWFDDDTAAVVDLGLAGIIVPKLRSVDELRRAEARLDELRAPDGFELWAIVESASFLLDVERTATLPSRLRALVAGMVDLTLDLSPASFLGPDGLDGPDARARASALRARILVAARAHDCTAVDAVTVAAVTDADLAEREAVRARHAGFDSMIVLHPAQLESVNRGMRPSDDELATARAFVEAGDEAARSDRVSAIVDGRIVLPQHIEVARATLRPAAAAS